MTLEDLTESEMEDSRLEAKLRHPNINFDEIFNELFMYYEAEHKEPLSEMIYRKEVEANFIKMIDLNYSPICIATYARYWAMIRQDANYGE